MRKSRVSEEQSIGMLREHEAGVATADLCRKYGLSSAPFYKYKAKFGGMTVSDAQRLPRSGRMTVSVRASPASVRQLPRLRVWCWPPSEAPSRPSAAAGLVMTPCRGPHVAQEVSPARKSPSNT